MWFFSHFEMFFACGWLYLRYSIYFSWSGPLSLHATEHCFLSVSLSLSLFLFQHSKLSRDGWQMLWRIPLYVQILSFPWGVAEVYIFLAYKDASLDNWFSTFLERFETSAVEYTATHFYITEVRKPQSLSLDAPRLWVKKRNGFFLNQFGNIGLRNF